MAKSTKHIAVMMAAAVLMLAQCELARAAVIANWGFELVTPPTVEVTAGQASQGPFAPDEGSGAASGVHAAPARWSTPNGNGSPTSWNSTVWAAGDYYQFEVSTAGLEDITIAWDQTRSSNGPATWDLQYATSTAGPFTTFVDDYVVPQATWDATLANSTTKFFADLGAISSLDDGTAVFRLVAQTAGVNTGGQSRVDNIIVSGTPVPEPTTVLGLVFVSLTRRRLRRRA